MEQQFTVRLAIGNKVNIYCMKIIREYADVLTINNLDVNCHIYFGTQNLKMT